MHYRGLLRVVRREAGIRIYGVHEHAPGPVDARERRVRLDALVDVVVNVYAPLPAASLSYAVRRLRYAVPQWSSAVTDALQRARQRLAHARVDGVDWYWPTAANSRVSPNADRTTRSSARAIRSGGLGPATLRAAVELGVSIRGLYAGAETPVGILRAAAAVARPRHWLGQRVGRRRRLDPRCWLCRRAAAARSSIPPGTRGRARSLVRVSRPPLRASLRLRLDAVDGLDQLGPGVRRRIRQNHQADSVAFPPEHIEAVRNIRGQWREQYTINASWEIPSSSARACA